ncbi:hypothetical protein CLG94_05710 [Candidatus Methylomirabilis limnetica]|uniref:Phosphotyrosine protein phosphatase I domain-containing protein n=2 Tax=Candidatus Methylomirabilis limnetica TaxID=2033718 RepID=A0A2T4TYI2_9BACT|nr:hypothetical protein CLG94_05710 [Candidatus Methylomirabilis limnetica]
MLGVIRWGSGPLKELHGMTEVRKPSVLFVCKGNTCRSVMAEALTRRRFGDAVQVASAGLRPQPPEDAKNAVETLRVEFNWDTSSHLPRHFRDIDVNSFDYVVAMDKYIAKELKGIPKERLLVWNIDDPWDNDMAEYKRCGLIILRYLSRLPITHSGQQEANA